MSAIAFIPARSGSQRIPGKNMRALGGRPLLAWAIEAAHKSGAFEEIYLSSDSDEYLDVGRRWGAKPIKRPAEYAAATSPDYQWLKHALMRIWDDVRPDVVAIVRCTSPFLRPESVYRAVKMLVADERADSVRAVRPVREHPGKMWTCNDFRMLPLMPYRLKGTPWHSNQMAALPRVYVQTGGLEVVRAEAVWRTQTISGDAIVPFEMDGEEALDINTPWDWALAELIVKARDVQPQG